MDIRNTIYFKQVNLLLEILPIISKIDDFALKGGTAINLFVQDFPRLSVDIDLTFVPITNREIALSKIDSKLKEIGNNCLKFIPGAQLNFKEKEGRSFGLIVSKDDIIVKIEPNSTLRGTVFPTSQKSLMSSVEKQFGKSLTTNVLSIEDLYAGKICAALDRQHPRDLFDIYLMNQTMGLTRELIFKLYTPQK